MMITLVVNQDGVYFLLPNARASPVNSAEVYILRQVVAEIRSRCAPRKSAAVPAGLIAGEKGRQVVWYVPSKRQRVGHLMLFVNPLSTAGSGD